MQWVIDADARVVIQNGTKHSWHNTSDEPATMLVCFVGANRTIAMEA